MRRLLTLLVGIFLAWLCAHPAEATPVEPGPSAVTYTYEHRQHATTRLEAATERGPPSTYTAIHDHRAVDLSSHGASARPQHPPTTTYNDYDRFGQLAQVTGGSPTTRTADAGRAGDVCAVSRSRCAANAVTRAPQVLRVGELKLSAVPKGVVGTPVRSGKGLDYAIPRGTPELSERVASIRIMDPVTAGKNTYPNGYAVYMNAQGQRVNPLTGQMIHDLSDPFAHIPLP